MASIEALAVQAERLIASWDHKARKNGRFPYPMERAILVLVGMNHGWTNTAIAHKAKSHPRTIENLRRRYIQEPGRIFECPVLKRGAVGVRNRVIWICAFCDLRIPAANERDARRHVCYHVLPPDVVKLNGVGM